MSPSSYYWHAILTLLAVRWWLSESRWRGCKWIYAIFVRAHLSSPSLFLDDVFCGRPYYTSDRKCDANCVSFSGYVGEVECSSASVSRYSCILRLVLSVIIISWQFANGTTSRHRGFSNGARNKIEFFDHLSSKLEAWCGIRCVVAALLDVKWQMEPAVYLLARQLTLEN